MPFPQLANLFLSLSPSTLPPKAKGVGRARGGDREGKITGSEDEVVGRENKVTDRKSEVASGEGKIVGKKGQVSGKEGEAAGKKSEVASREGESPVLDDVSTQ